MYAFFSYKSFIVFPSFVQPILNRQSLESNSQYHQRQRLNHDHEKQSTIRKLTFLLKQGRSFSPVAPSSQNDLA